MVTNGIPASGSRIRMCLCIRLLIAPWQTFLFPSRALQPREDCDGDFLRRRRRHRQGRLTWPAESWAVALSMSGRNRSLKELVRVPTFESAGTVGLHEGLASVVGCCDCFFLNSFVVPLLACHFPNTPLVTLPVAAGEREGLFSPQLDWWLSSYCPCPFSIVFSMC